MRGYLKTDCSLLILVKSGRLEMRSVLMGRTRCESYKSIDVRRWQRQGLLSPGTFFSQTWTRNGEPSGNIGVLVKDGCVTLGYRLGQNGRAARVFQLDEA
jgi:hypothetical protein